MFNLVEKFTPAVEADTNDEGLVTIEYVLGAVAVAAGVAIVWGTGIWDTMLAKLNGIFTAA
jgi:hypothetical protein